MSVKNVGMFYTQACTDSEISKRLQQINNKYLESEIDEDERLKIIEQEIIPLAKEFGLEFTLDELKEYNSSNLSSMSDDELQHIDGGVISAVTDKNGNILKYLLNGCSPYCSCFMIGHGSAIKEYNIKNCGCFIGGGGKYKEKESRMYCILSGQNTSLFNLDLSTQYQIEQSLK